MEDSSRIRPLGTNVLLQAVRARTAGGLILPVGYEDRYPQSGVVKAKGRNATLEIGDLCVLPDEGTDSGNSYYQVFSITLLGEREPISCALEVEPTVREYVRKFRANAATHDYNIVVKTIESETVKFNASDVLDYGIVDLSNAGLRLEYVPVKMLYLFVNNAIELFYIAREEEILATIKGY